MSNIITGLVETVTAFVALLADRARGKSTKVDEAKLRKAGLEAAHALIERAEAVLGMQLATDELATVLQHLRDEMHRAESGGGLPRILDGADVQQMPADWHPPKGDE